MFDSTLNRELWPVPGHIFYHFKRNPNLGIEHGAYLIQGVGKNTEDRQQHFVILKPLYYCNPRQVDEQNVSYELRPLDYFFGDVNRPGYIGKRFTLITDDKLIAYLKQTFLYTSKYLDE